MSYTISQIFDKEAPHLASDTDKDYFIDQAELFYDSNCFGTKYNLIVALRAAHDMTIRDLQGGAGLQSSGNVVSKREGNQSITFGNTQYDPSSDKYLQLTRYGQKLLSIKRSTVLGIRVSGDNETLDSGCLPFCL